MNRGLRLFFLSLAIFSFSFAQKDFSECNGYIHLNPNVNYQIQFKGAIGKNKSGVQYYCQLPINSNNFIWLQFCPDNNGVVQLTTKENDDSLLLVVFEVDPKGSCSYISGKKAELKGCERRSARDTSAQRHSVKANYQYYFALYAKKGKRMNLEMQLNYTPLSKDGKQIRDSLCLNLVTKRDLPIYSFHFREAQTNLPVVARLSVMSTGLLDGIYRGSDIFLNNQKKLKANLRIEAEGYYPLDLSSFSIPATSHQDTFMLNPIRHGAITKLEDLYFKGGLAVILEESLPRLRRLKDFLLLNPTISIEVQGHVNDEGGNSLNSLRLSKNRAKKVVEFLIESGIEPSRLSAVGLGNSAPVFPDPQSEEEKEANRRVEIKIK